MNIFMMSQLPSQGTFSSSSYSFLPWYTTFLTLALYLLWPLDWFPFPAQQVANPGDTLRPLSESVSAQTLFLLWNTLTLFSNFTPSLWECFISSDTLFLLEQSQAFPTPLWCTLWWHFWKEPPSSAKHVFAHSYEFGMRIFSCGFSFDFLSFNRAPQDFYVYHIVWNCIVYRGGEGGYIAGHQAI